MATDSQLLGCEFAFDIGSNANAGETPVDLETTDVTVLVDDSAGSRDVYRWRPSGSSDPEFSYDADTGLRFALDSTAVAAIPAGATQITILYDTPATTQKELAQIEVTFRTLTGGVPPVVDS